MAFHGGQEVQLIRQGAEFDFVLAFTLESWVKAAEDMLTFYGGQMGNEMCIHGFATMGAGPRISIVHDQVGPCAAAGSCPYGAYAFLAPTMPEHRMCHTPVPDAAWHHVAATWDNATARLYLDGVETCTYSPLPSLIDLDIARNAVLSKHAYSLGALPDHYRFFKGELDDVRLWRTVRSAAEVAQWMHRHLDATQQAGLEVELRFDECSGDTTANHGPLAGTGELASGTVGIRLADGVVGIGSAPGWVPSRAPIFGASGRGRVGLDAGTGTSTWRLQLRALESTMGTMINARVVLPGAPGPDGGLQVSASGASLNVELLPARAGRIEGGEQLMSRHLSLGQRTVQYRLEQGGNVATGQLEINVRGNRAPQLGEAGHSLSFSQSAYAGSLGLTLRHRGVAGQSGANHSAKLTIEFWSKNSLSDLQEAGNMGTALFTFGNSEDNRESWSPMTCGRNGGCHGRGSGHMPWSAGFPWTFFHFGITHLPMSAQLPCRWAQHSGEWQHVAFVADPDTEFHGIYFNGQLCNPGSRVDGPTADLSSFFLGVWPILKAAADTVHHTGEIDEMRIWSTARTAEEIAGGMFRGPTDAEKASGDLLASWSFDDCGTTETAICRDASGNGNDLLFAVCGPFSDYLAWDGFNGPGGPNAAACQNLTYPAEAHSSSWPTRHVSHVPVHGPFAAVRPRTMEEETSRRLDHVVITAVDPDAEDRLELEFLELPPSVGRFFLKSTGQALATGDRVPMQLMRPLVHSVTLRVEDLGRGAITLGHLRLRVRDRAGALSDEASVEVRAHIAGPGQEFVERLGRVQPCPRGHFANGTGEPCQKCPRGTYGPLPLTWRDSSGNAECLPCGEGTFGFESGLSSCAECEAGRFSAGRGSTSCSSCPVGSFSAGRGASTCRPCERGTTTQQPGSSSPDFCHCPEGQFMMCAQGHQRSNLTLCSVERQPPVGQCQRCTKGLVCPGGATACPSGSDVTFTCPAPAHQLHAQPLLRQGFYASREDPLYVFQCQDLGACPGQASLADPVCAEHHEGVNCGRCAAGRFRPLSRRTSVCEECAGSSGWFLILSLLAVWAVLGAGLWLRQRFEGGIAAARRNSVDRTAAASAVAAQNAVDMSALSQVVPSSPSSVPPAASAAAGQENAPTPEGEPPALGSQASVPGSLEDPEDPSAEVQAGTEVQVFMPGLVNAGEEVAGPAGGAPPQPAAPAPPPPAELAALSKVEEQEAQPGWTASEEQVAAGRTSGQKETLAGASPEEAIVVEAQRSRAGERRSTAMGASNEESAAVGRQVAGGSFVSGFGQGVTFMQRLAVFDMMSIAWPVAVDDFFGFCSSIFMGIGTFNLSCIVGTGFAAQYLIILSIPAVVWLLGLSWYGVHLATNRRIRAFQGPKVFNVLGLFTLTFYTVILVHTVSLLDCYENPNHARTLRKYPQVVCGDSMQLQAMPAAVFAIILYVCGFMALCVVLLLRAPQKFTDPSFRDMVQFLIFKYHPQVYWYSLVVAARSLCFSLLTVVAPQSISIQFWLMSLTLLASLILQLSLRPMRSCLSQLLEVTEQVMLLAILTVGVSVLVPEEQTSGEQPADLAEQLILAGVGIYMVLAFLTLCYSVLNALKPELLGAGRTKTLDEAHRRLCLVSEIILAEPRLAREVFSRAPKQDLDVIQSMTGFWLLERGGLRHSGCAQRLPLVARSTVPFTAEALSDIEEKAIASRSCSRGWSAK